MSAFALLVACGSLLLLGSSCAAPINRPPAGYQVRAVERYNNTIVEIGTTEFTVRRVLGEPRHTLGSNTWVYDRFQVVPERRPDDDCEMLVITFTQQRVSDMKLVNRTAEKVIAARLKTDADNKASLASK